MCRVLGSLPLRVLGLQSLPQPAATGQVEIKSCNHVLPVSEGRTWEPYE